MADADKTVFLSYRRAESWALADLVRNDLSAHGFDVFLDRYAIGGGRFEPAILREIETRTHFVLLLEPRSLDRIAEPGDWLRREIAHALAHGRNIVPLRAGNTPAPSREDLPADVAPLAAFQTVEMPHGYVPEAMQKLRRFLGGAGEPESGGPPVLSSRRVGGRLHTELRWTGVPGAKNYVLERSNTPGFGVAPVRYDGQELGFLDRFTFIGPWYYRVRADREDVVGVWSSPLRVL